jgi:lipopolysaccharide transport system permease protein
VNAPPPRPGASLPTTPAAHLRRYWLLVRSFAVNDIRKRYVGSLMGFFWTVVQPLIELVTYTFVFTVILLVRFEPQYDTLTNALYLFRGMIAWLSLSESLSRSVDLIRENAHLIKKLSFPPSVLLASVVLSDGFSAVVRMMMLFVAALLSGQGITWHALLFVPVLALQMVFTMGLSMLLATTQVYFKDTRHLLGPALLIWMFITPIFYPASLFPKQFAPLLMLNPLSHLVGLYRELVLNHVVPQWGSVLIFTTMALTTFGLGVVTFVRHSRRFPDLV